MYRTSLISIFVIVLFYLFGCSKNTVSTSTPCPYQNSNLSGTWKLTKVLNDGKDVSDTFFKLNPCYRTESLTFNSNQSYNYSNSVSNCPVTISGTWELSSTIYTNYLIFNNGSKTTATITNFDCNSIQILIGNITYVYTK